MHHDITVHNVVRNVVVMIELTIIKTPWNGPELDQLRKHTTPKKNSFFEGKAVISHPPRASVQLINPYLTREPQLIAK